MTENDGWFWRQIPDSNVWCGGPTEADAAAAYNCTLSPAYTVTSPYRELEARVGRHFARWGGYPRVVSVGDTAAEADAELVKHVPLPQATIYPPDILPKPGQAPLPPV